MKSLWIKLEKLQRKREKNMNECDLLFEDEPIDTYFDAVDE